MNKVMGALNETISKVLLGQQIKSIKEDFETKTQAEMLRAINSIPVINNIPASTYIPKQYPSYPSATPLTPINTMPTVMDQDWAKPYKDSPVVGLIKELFTEEEMIKYLENLDYKVEAGYPDIHVSKVYKVDPETEEKTFKGDLIPFFTNIVKDKLKNIILSKQVLKFKL